MVVIMEVMKMGKMELVEVEEVKEMMFLEKLLVQVVLEL